MVYLVVSIGLFWVFFMPFLYKQHYLSNSLCLICINRFFSPCCSAVDIDNLIRMRVRTYLSFLMFVWMHARILLLIRWARSFIYIIRTWLIVLYAPPAFQVSSTQTLVKIYNIWFCSKTILGKLDFIPNKLNEERD